MIQYSNLDRVMDARDHFKNVACLKSHMSKRNCNRNSMKIHKVLILLILTVSLFSSCGKNELDNSSDIHDYRVNDVLYPKNAKLKQVSNCGGKEIWYPQSEYEYDDFGRISKVSHPMYDNGSIIGIIGYEIYVYNTKSQLEEIEYYRNNIYTGLQYSRSDKYSYDNDGNKIKEETSPTEYILYYYENNRLKRAEHFFSHFVMYTEYEYDNYGNLVKESTYSANDDTPLRYSVHSYQDRLNVKTEDFEYYNVIGKTKLREIRRYYDKNDNLIYLEPQNLSILSSTILLLEKYEYY